jgi:hypothetical protein
MPNPSPGDLILHYDYKLHEYEKEASGVVSIFMAVGIGCFFVVDEEGAEYCVRGIALSRPKGGKHIWPEKHPSIKELANAQG